MNRMRLRPRIEPVRVAIPTYKRLGVMDSSGEMIDFTRSKFQYTGSAKYQGYEEVQDTHFLLHAQHQSTWIPILGHGHVCPSMYAGHVGVQYRFVSLALMEILQGRHQASALGI